MDLRWRVLSALATAPCLIVLLTPKSALSRWVWVEAGNRLGQVDRANPLFVCPSERFTALLGPVGDKKSLNLDNEDELVELVQAVGKILGRTPRDYLSCKPALADLAAASRREYSTTRERRDKVVAAVKRHWLPAVLTPLMLLAGYWYRNTTLESTQAALDSRDVQRNQDVAALAARYFILTGTVVALKSNEAVADAIVMASRDPEVRDRTACQEPLCTFWTTDTDGKFSLDLTKIRAVKDEMITLIVVKPGFVTNTKLLQIDVRALDATVAPQSVKLAMPMEPAPGTSP